MRCGQFSHELLDPRDRTTFGQIKLVRCTIVAINPRYNTADVEFGIVPPDNFSPPELIDIDCPDIPVFEGDEFSDDGQRRRFMDVPIYYHCQGSTGTIAELKTGHMAFKVPPVELTNPPWLQETVEDVHKQVLREKVLLLYIPPSSDDLQSNPDHTGYRYVIGHTDRNDVAPCKSEYLCIRLIRDFDLAVMIPDPNNPGFYISNPGFGWAKEEETTIIHILDPIGGRVYRGLEQHGISFPCSAETILDKVRSIVIDDNTPLQDILFLDTLHSIDALYNQSFFAQPPYVYLGVPNYVTYYPRTDCNEWKPERLCWLQHWFDIGLQCEINSLDPREFVEPWDTAVLGITDTDYSSSNTITFYRRSYGQFINGEYYQIMTSYGPYDTNIPDYAPFNNVISHIEEYEDDPPYRKIYEYLETELGYNNLVLHSGFHGNWVDSTDTNFPLCVSYYIQDLFSHNIRESNLSGYIQYSSEYSLNIKFYCPWLIDAWYEDTLYGNLSVGDVYSGYPDIFRPYQPVVNGEMMAVGRSATYAMHVEIYYYDGFNRTGSNSDSFVIDHTKYRVKVRFGFNPDFWKGQDGVDAIRRDPRSVKDLPGCSDFLETELTKMYELFRIPVYEYSYWTHSVTGEHIPAYAAGYFSAYIIDVVE